VFGSLGLARALFPPARSWAVRWQPCVGARARDGVARYPGDGIAHRRRPPRNVAGRVAGPSEALVRQIKQDKNRRGATRKRSRSESALLVPFLPVPPFIAVELARLRRRHADHKTGVAVQRHVFGVPIDGRSDGVKSVTCSEAIVFVPCRRNGAISACASAQ
jgi:hypothetical protein